MVQQRPKRSRYAVVIGLVVALASTFLACEFDSPGTFDYDTPKGINEILNGAPIRSLSEGDRWTVYEEPGKIRVQHGYGCAKQGFVLDPDEGYVGFRIQDIEAVPLEFGDAGTIILNGWDVQYTNGDHHVLGLGTAIFNMTETLTPTQLELRWEAGGVLSDKNGNDGYQWCYRYTLVFWNRGAIDAVVPAQDDVSTTFVGKYDHDSDLVKIPGEFTYPSDGYGPRAVLPRGLGLVRDSGDKEVLQVAFDLGTPPVGEPLMPVTTGNTISWTSQMILKDNATDSSLFNGANLVTILSGQSVYMWQPRSVLHLTGIPPAWVEEPTELNLEPAEPCSEDPVGYSEQYLEFYSVEKVPYDYAIPVLTGWDLQYGCEDHHVERIGVYLVEFEYVKPPNAATGTLNYTIFSTLRDDSDNGHAAQYKVSILGFKELGGGSDK